MDDQRHDACKRDYAEKQRSCFEANRRLDETMREVLPQFPDWDHERLQKAWDDWLLANAALKESVSAMRREAEKALPPGHPLREKLPHT
jgi:hypothetical protein